MTLRTHEKVEAALATTAKTKPSPIKKAAANAAAKVRRSIKELQINVCVHSAMNRKIFNSSKIEAQYPRLIKPRLQLVPLKARSE